MRTATLLLATMLALPAYAGGRSGGGFGVSADARILPKYGAARDGTGRPDSLGCLGFMGHSFSSSGFRWGGNGRYCGDGEGTRVIEGGPHFGFRKGRSIWLTSVIGIGTGVMTDTSGESRYRAFYGYLRPSTAVGFHIGGLGVEVGPFVNLPLNLVQWVGTDGPRGILAPQFGATATVMFGKFRQPKRQVHAPAAPVMVTTPPPPAPPPADPPQDPPEDTDRPLAIPGGY
jgi:hypothetical protein